MELRHCRYFTAIAEERSLSAAARRLRLSQPALSKQLKDLETELGVTLLFRQPAGVRLTPAGETFLVHATDLLHRAAATIAAVRPKRQPASRIIKVTYVAGAIPDNLIATIHHARSLRPPLTIQLQALAPQEQLHHLREGAIDLALLGNPPAEWKREFATRVLSRLPIVALIPASHPLARHSAIDLAQLAADDFIGLAEQHFPGRNHCIRHSCQRAGFEPRLTSFAESLEVLATLVAAGAGVALAPSFPTPPPGVHILRLRKPRVWAESVAAWPKQQPHPAIPTLLQLLAQTTATPTRRP